MRRVVAALVGLLTGVAAIVVGRRLRRPNRSPRPTTPIPATLPPRSGRAAVPRSTDPAPGRADAPVGEYLATAPRREQVWVAVLVVAVCVAAGLVFLFMLPG